MSMFDFKFLRDLFHGTPNREKQKPNPPKKGMRGWRAIRNYTDIGFMVSAATKSEARAKVKKRISEISGKKMKSLPVGTKVYPV